MSTTLPRLARMPLGLATIRGKCHVDDITGCWVWRLGLSEGRYPRVYAMDYTKGCMRVQTGQRAVWHAATEQPIPEGKLIYRVTCTNVLCLNPMHMACGTKEEWGQHLADSGQWKGIPDRIAANRAIGRKRSIITPELLREIKSSPETGMALSRRTGISQPVISRARRGEMTSVEQVVNPFAQLMQAAA